MKDTTELKRQILEHLRPEYSIAIMSHVEPDGDGFAACIALQKYFRARGFESEIVIDPDSHLERFSFIMNDVVLREYVPGLKYDLVFVLDCNSYIRIAEREQLVRSAKHGILIDHHVPENGVIKTDFSFVDTSAVSVGAILWKAIGAEILQLSPEQRIPIAESLYVTILNDTNNFVNANTSAEVFAISSELTECGISPSQLYKAYFLNHEPLELRYIGEVLSTIELHGDDRILWMNSSLDMQRRNDLTADSIMNITRWVQGVRGVLAIAYLREEISGTYKLSLRSPVLDVNAVASSFGGGGHRSASGATIHGELHQIKAELLAKLGAALASYTEDA